MLTNSRRGAIWLVPFVLLSAILLGGCDNTICFGPLCFGGSPPPPPASDSPGYFSYYAQEAFTNPNLSSFCLLSTVQPCVFVVANNFAQPLTAAGWTPNNQITDGFYNGAWTSAETTASQVINDQANLVYISSHGGTLPGQAVICLRDCNGMQVGGTVGVGTADIPLQWSGPNWFIIDACQVVQPGVGWEGVFGGHLHGILGYSQPTDGLNLGGFETLTKLIIGYDTATDAWEQAVAAGGDSTLLGMLVPAANAQDRIEARGGPHFGTDGNTNPVYTSCCAAQAGVVTAGVSHLASPSSSVFSLAPEVTDENYWYTYYGGAQVPHSLTNPSANEHLYRNQYILVDHFLASGGLLVASEPTGTARGVSESQAYQYAQSWIQSNGTLPVDAQLTFAGAETMSPVQLPVADGAPYPGVRQYVLIWRHQSSGVLAGDKIQAGVDDDGYWGVNCYGVYRQHCVNNGIWYGSPHLTTYVRIWRSLGANTASIVRQNYTMPQQITPSAPSGNALCASDMALPTSSATPCDVYTTSSGTNGYVNPATGALLGTSERM